ncbi:DUF4302 domain-containing protein [Hyunsoonleella sp. 2307UL5-6]|uniref:DUF4302 domain-containing protein n=1 Tax=Hyunsoonleella sp. 2307UL5-6 TaxID=3384768 RepID=UPI0039BC2B67
MKLITKNSFLKLLFLSFLVFSSCSDDEDQNIFDQTPSERVDQAINELQELLLAQPNGYKAVYFTKNDERGGFTTFMQFNADGTVRQTSDFNDDIDLQNSSYEVRLGTSIELVFTTRNHITKGTDPTAITEVINGFPTGLGFFGTSVFQFFSNDNGVLTFRDIRNSDTALMVLYPTNFTDFDTESISAVNQLRNQIPRIAEPELYQVFEIENANGGIKYDMLYNETRRFTNLSGFSETEIINLTFGVAYTEEGITISPALEFEGVSYSDFIYDETTERFVSTVDGTTASIYYSNAPAFINPNDLIELEELGPTGFLYRRSLGDNPLTSGSHDDMLAQIEANLGAAFGSTWQVAQYQLSIDFESDDCDTFLFVQIVRADGAAFNLFYCFLRGDISDGRLFLTYDGPGGGASGQVEPLILPLIEFFATPNGLTFARHGAFSSDTFNFSNPSGSFTNSDSGIRVYGLFFG